MFLIITFSAQIILSISRTTYKMSTYQCILLEFLNFVSLKTHGYYVTVKQ